MNFSSIFNSEIGRDYIRHGLIYRLLKFWGLRDLEFLYIKSHPNLPKSISVMYQYEYTDLDHAPRVSESQDIYASKNDVGRFSFSVSGGIIDAFSARIYTPDLTFIADSSAWSVPHAVKRWPAQIGRISQKRISLISDSATFVPSQNYFHWLMEDLPSLLRILRLNPGIRVLIAPNTKNYILDALNFLKVPFHISPTYVQVENLIYESRGPALIPQSIDVLELNQFANDVHPHSVGGAWIYISRRDSGRIPDNEDDVELLMKSFGVQILSLVGKSTQEQIELFRNADVVVGTHGAGLSNIAWCRSEISKVIEIRKGSQPLCFRLLAAQKAMAYFSVESNEESSWMVDISSLTTVLIKLRKTRFGQ